jgi:hypothetical protein
MAGYAFVGETLSAAGIRAVLALEHVGHDEVLRAVGGHYGGVVPTTDALDDAARPLFGVVGAPSEVQARRVAEVLFLDLGLSPDDRSADALILPAALVTRRADPLVLAMLGHELARRAGLESHVCVAGDDAWTALLDGDCCTLVGSAVFASGEAHERGFHIACAHETATSVLERLASRALGAMRECAADIAHAMRCGSRDVRDCPGHGSRL